MRRADKGAPVVLIAGVFLLVIFFTQILSWCEALLP